MGGHAVAKTGTPALSLLATRPGSGQTPSMLGARILLSIHATMCVGYGIAAALRPGDIAEYMGLTIASGDGRAEVFAMYVGANIAMGAGVAYAAMNERWLSFGVRFVAVFLSGIIAGRLLGIAAGGTGSYTLSALAYDIPAAGYAWYWVSTKRNAGSTT